MVANVEPLHIRKTVDLPVPFGRLFLGWDLKPLEAWTHLSGAIINGGLEVYGRPLIYWIPVTLTLKNANKNRPWLCRDPPPRWPMETSSGKCITCSSATSLVWTMTSKGYRGHP